MRWKKWALLAASFSTLALAACGNGESGADTASADSSADNSENTETAEPEDEQQDNKGKVSGPAVGIKEVVENEGEPIEGGTLKVALVSDDPFQGIFSSEFAIDAIDGNLMSFSHDGLFQTDPDGRLNDKGITSEEIDKENKTVTFHIRDDAKWSDGEPLTADDIIFTHELLASPEYDGLRYDPDDFEKIEGAKEFHEGNADHISGIEKIDDQTVKFHLSELSLSLKYGFGGPWSSVAPKHQLENIPISEIKSSPEVRDHPVGLGPFRVTKVVPGESVEYEANEYYYQGRPKIDKVEVTRVPESGAIPALENHKYDIVLGVPSGSYDSYKDTPGYDFLTEATNSYSYIGFKLGKLDKEKGENIPDPNSKLANPKLRQAFGYAVDNDLVGKRFFQGLVWNANSKIPPVFEGLYDPEQPGFYYDPDKSRQLLDEAGYKDVNGDGYVEDPDGNELVFKLANTVGGDTAEPITQYYIQAWKDVGLHVELTDGRLLDYQNFAERLRDDDPSIEIYLSGWGVGSDPNPYQLDGRRAILNYSRWATEEQDALLDSLVDDQAFDDPEYQAQQYKKWQQYIVDDPQTIPIYFSLSVTPINKRIKRFDNSRDPDKNTGWHEIELTADEPLAE